MNEMGLFRSVGVALALALSSTAASAQDRPAPHAPVHGGAKVAGTSLSIDELYRTKSLIGTTPEGYSWAADGDTVLFLWNDEGYSFRDIWSYSVRTGKKTRLTFLGRDSKPEAEQKGIAQAVALDRGRVAFTLGGQLHIREANGTVTPVETDKQAVRKLAVSPDGTRLAFISGNPVDTRNRVTLGGVLWVRDVAAKGGNAARRVAGDDDPKVYIGDFQWSADGKAIAFEQSDDRAMPERDIYYYAKGGLQNNRVIRAFPGDETTKATVGVVTLASGDVRFSTARTPRIISGTMACRTTASACSSAAPTWRRRNTASMSSTSRAGRAKPSISCARRSICVPTGRSHGRRATTG